MRRLATIRKIDNVVEIPGADKIELVMIDGWQCVAQKGEFKPGSLCVYFEIDSILPKHAVFDFMQPRKYRVRTIKCMKHISQGLAKPLSILKELGIDPTQYKTDAAIGTDLSDVIRVTKYDPEAAREEANRLKTPGKPAPWYIRLLRRIPIVGKYFQRRRGAGNFPTHIVSKTDEERWQNMSHGMKSNFVDREIDFTEKIDGTSTTFIYRPNNWLMKLLMGETFMVCSRNFTKVHNDGSWWWKSAENCSANKIMRRLHESMKLPANTYLVLQGETIGPDIQKNKYKVKDYKFYLFNLKEITCKGASNDVVEYSPSEIKKMLFVHNIPMDMVPVLDLGVKCKSMEDLESLVKTRPWGHMSRLLPTQIAEGFVCRLGNQRVNMFKSFKYINPEFSLKYEGEDEEE